jgi:hypothetical protein
LSNHELMHGMEAADGCLYEWAAMQGCARARKCSVCKLNVIDIEGLTEPDMAALVYAQGLDPGSTKLFRRSDGRFVLGDCFKKRYGNFPTAVGFAIAPFASYAFLWHLPAAALIHPVTYWIMTPALIWLFFGVTLLCKTRSPTLSGVVFTIFVLPAILAPVFLGAY